MEESFKRINKETGKPFKPGFKDDSGRIFLRYLNKHGNDGYYLEEWKKDMESFLKNLGIKFLVQIKILNFGPQEFLLLCT